ncbi:MAG: ABC transporter ATP-binding protein [Clostridium sp.]
MGKIEVKNLSKKIKGNVILDDINGLFEGGKIYGIYGRNASGKTMFFRAICGLIRADEGQVIINDRVLGEDLDFPEACGVMLENPGFWPEYSAFENLKQLSKIKNIISDNEIKDILNKVGLNSDDKKKFRKFSLGMKQKLGIAQALMENPQILILDEPTNALDDVSVINIRELIKEQKKRGAIVLIASHNKDDIDELADVKLRMDQGKLSSIEVQND